jgi:hypothetical protein
VPRPSPVRATGPGPFDTEPDHSIVHVPVAVSDRLEKQPGEYLATRHGRDRAEINPLRRRQLPCQDSLELGDELLKSSTFARHERQGTRSTWPPDARSHARSAGLVTGLNDLDVVEHSCGLATGLVRARARVYQVRTNSGATYARRALIRCAKVYAEILASGSKVLPLEIQRRIVCRDTP